MLVLTRRIGESIIIDGEIEVRVMQVSGNRTRIGIKAPADRSIMRTEILERRSRDASGRSMTPAVG